MQLCDTCFKLYKLFSFIKIKNEFEPIIEYPTCLDKNCNGNLFEVDELFAPIIIMLNKKGYKTLFCCSGHIKSDEELIFCKKYQKHYKNKTIDSYITFHKLVTLPNIPKGYKFDKYIAGHELNNTIRKEFNPKKQPKNILIDILENTKIVLEWAESLPEIK